MSSLANIIWMSSVILIMVILLVMSFMGLKNDKYAEKKGSLSNVGVKPENRE